MRKQKGKTAVDKAMDLIFEEGVDGKTILGQGDEFFGYPTTAV